ncbi:MAG: hypothetical protein ACE5HD_00405 [Acidobacteriota bacterium]
MLPVALLGGEGFDVREIDPGSLLLAGVPPLDHGAIGPVQDGESAILTVTGSLRDGTPIRGQDCVRILAKR